MEVTALDTLHSYAAAYRFLNRVLQTESERAGDSEWYEFISINGELLCGASGLASHDPAYWPDDWVDALGGTSPVTPAGGYAGLLAFLRAFAARGCDDAFRAMVATMSRTDKGLPAGPALRGLWMDAWHESERADVPAAIAMTRYPHTGPTWRIGEGWSP